MNGRVASANSVASDPIREVDECSEPCGSHGMHFVLASELELIARKG
jgi:hypothetical protein